MPTVLLVRHGQASYGTADYDVLSEKGHRQAAVVAGELAARGVRPAVLVSGALHRQRDTAAPFGEPEIDPAWDEYRSDDILEHHSDTDVRLEVGGGRVVDDRTFQDLLDEAMLRWMAAGEGGGARETWPAFLARATGALDRVAARLGSGETGVVATSGGVIAAIAVATMGLEAPAFLNFNRAVVNASVTKVIRGQRGYTFVSFNEQGHLERAGEDLITYR